MTRRLIGVGQRESHPPVAFYCGASHALRQVGVPRESESIRLARHSGDEQCELIDVRPCRLR